MSPLDLQIALRVLQLTEDERGELFNLFVIGLYPSEPTRVMWMRWGWMHAYNGRVQGSPTGMVAFETMRVLYGQRPLEADAVVGEWV